MADYSNVLAHFGASDGMEPSQKAVEAAYFTLAVRLQGQLLNGPEKTVAFRKLLESKDCAIRALTHGS